jgi:cytochrome c biogenesis protein CcmG/thiol:disulfide interchange protein DsbE
MKGYVRWFAPLVFFLAVAAFCLWGLYHDPKRIPSPLVGKPMVAFHEPDLLNSQKVLDQSIFDQHYTLLNVFATWCITCHAEHPILMDIAKRYPQLQMVGLNYKDHDNDSRDWLAHYGNPYRWVIADHDGHLARALGVYGTPETFLIDPQGHIIYKHIGAISPMVWRDELQPFYLQQTKQAGRK